MKKRKILQTAALSVLLASTITAGVSFAWFYTTANIGGNQGEANGLPIIGSSKSAYFAYGKGTSSSPYGIKTPRHLYNLAWLQYLGYFNDQQYYFELADDIDMSGWTLPPIGTEEYPFISNFNGQSYTVSNLNVSNQFSDYNVHPGVISGFTGDYTQPHILGMFGVVGNVEGVTEYSYDTATNEIKNLGITGLAISNKSSTSLMGLAAGYVNGTLSNVAVDASSLNIQADTGALSYTNKLSDYGVVGYCTENYKKSFSNVTESIYDVNVTDKIKFNATESGNATGWGGSIDMKSVLERLISIKNANSKATFAYRKSYYYHPNTPNPTPVNTNDNGITTTLVNNDDEIGHYVFLHRNDEWDANYALMGGGHYEIHNYYEYQKHTGHKITDGTNYLNLERTEGYYETTGSISNGTESGSATIWNFTTGTSSISFRYANTGNNASSTTYEDYYLLNNNGTLEISRTNQTNWTITEVDNENYTISSNGYYLVYANGWILYNPSQPNNYYKIHDGSHYMAPASRYYALSTTDSSKAAVFEYDSSSNRYKLTTNTSYYLGFYSTSYPVQIWSDGDNYYRLVDTSGNEITSHYGTGYLRAYTSRGETTNYYVSWSGTDTSNPWTYVTNRNNATLMHVDRISDEITSYNLKTTPSEESSGPDEYFDSSKSKSSMVYTDQDVTYFPLTTINNTSNFKPADNNTAYVISGSSYTATNANESARSNVRFSNLFSLDRMAFGNRTLPKSLSNDYNPSTGTFSHIYTVTKSGSNFSRSEITNDYTNYTKLKDAKQSLGSVLNSTNNPSKKVYGVHFMDSVISMNALMTAKYVKVNGIEHTNYELPVNSIDFNLKEFGYINFMAGTYYSNNSSDRNDSFFSVYQIERLDDSPNKINRILEIKNIYQHTSKAKNISYVYELTDGSSTFYTKPYKLLNSQGDKEWVVSDGTEYSNNQYVNSLPANYTKVFDVDVIKKNNISSSNFDYHPFYFEIPMNDGEFCLGSVAGGTGAYLMYLDIGANAAETQRTEIIEHFTSTATTYEYPLGIALISPSSATQLVDGKNAIVVDELDTALISVEAGYSGEMKMTRTSISDVTINRTNTASSSKAKPTYVGDKITLIHDSGGTTPIEVVPKSSITTDILRLQYYDWNVSYSALTKTIITDTSINGGDYSRTIEQFKVDDSGTETAVASENVKIYNGTNGVRITNPEDRSALSFASSATTIIIQFKYASEDSSLVRTLNMVVNESETTSSGIRCYKFEGYTFTFEITEGSVKVIVLALGTGTFVIGGTTVTTVGQEITVNP